MKFRGTGIAEAALFLCWGADPCGFDLRMVSRDCFDLRTADSLPYGKTATVLGFCPSDRTRDLPLLP